MDQRPTYAALVAARMPALLRLAVMLTGNRVDADDLVQQTLLRAQRHGDRIAGMDAPSAYLRRILVNEHLSAGRRSRRTPVVTLLEPDVLTTGTDPTEELELRDATWRLLTGLPPQQRAVLALRYYEDLPDAEIAEILRCSPGTVRSHASRAFATLRERLTAPEATR